jgi:hypothetical protein
VTGFSTRNIRSQRFSPAFFRKEVASLDDLEASRFQYSLLIGYAFISVSLLEDAIGKAIVICNRLNVSGSENSSSPLEKLIFKRDEVRKKTLGNLIKILKDNNCNREDIDYLKWVQSRRDYFIHRFFHDGRWPDDVHFLGDLAFLSRHLVALDIIFRRAASAVWRILGRNGFMQYHDLNEAGALLMNHDLFDGDQDNGSAKA